MNDELEPETITGKIEFRSRSAHRTPGLDLGQMRDDDKGWLLQHVIDEVNNLMASEAMHVRRNVTINELSRNDPVTITKNMLGEVAELLVECVAVRAGHGERRTRIIEELADVIGCVAQLCHAAEIDEELVCAATIRGLRKNFK